MSNVGRNESLLAKKPGASARSAFPCRDNAGGPAPETLSPNESFCNKEEEISISSSTWKVATLAHVLRDDLGLLIVRPAARRVDPERKSSRYKIQKKLGQIAVPFTPNRW